MKKIKYSDFEHEWLVELYYINNYYKYILSNKKGLTNNQIKNHFEEYKKEFPKIERPWNSFRAWCKNLEFFFNEKKSLSNYAPALKKALYKKIFHLIKNE